MANSLNLQLLHCRGKRLPVARAIVPAIFVLAYIGAAAPPASLPTAHDFTNDLTRIEHLSASTDLRRAATLLDDIERRWKPAGRQYTDLLCRACEILTSQAGYGQPGRTLADAKSRAAFDEGLPMSIETRLRLALCLRLRPSPPDEVALPGWRADRKKLAERWVGALAELHQAIDRDFDFSKLPQLNVAPPVQTGLPAGVAPDEIADPDLRAQYRRAIDQNSRYAAEFGRQHHLRQLLTRFGNPVEARLRLAYAAPPTDLPELRALLETHLGERSTADRILVATQKEIAARANRPAATTRSVTTRAAPSP